MVIFFIKFTDISLHLPSVSNCSTFFFFLFWRNIYLWQVIGKYLKIVNLFYSNLQCPLKLRRKRMRKAECLQGPTWMLGLEEAIYHLECAGLHIGKEKKEQPSGSLAILPYTEICHLILPLRRRKGRPKKNDSKKIIRQNAPGSFLGERSS